MSPRIELVFYKIKCKKTQKLKYIPMGFYYKNELSWIHFESLPYTFMYFHSWWHDEKEMLL